MKGRDRPLLMFEKKASWFIMLYVMTCWSHYVHGVMELMELWIMELIQNQIGQFNFHIKAGKILTY